MDTGIKKNTNLFNTNMMNKSDELLNNVYPCFQPLLKRVLHSDEFGVARDKIELLNVTSSQDNSICDRFKIAIPYAKQVLHWTVMFDATNPELGPDFDFNDKTFLCDPNIHLIRRYLPNLTSWNTANINSLLNVLKELVFCYKLHEKEKLTERLSTEYSRLVQESKISEEDLEIILLPEPHEAHFLIKIPSDFPQLPEKYKSDNIAIMLHIIYQGINLTRIAAHIYYSSSMNDILGNGSNIRHPQISSSKSLLDHVISIQKTIVDKVNERVTHYEKKKSYIQTLLCLHGESVIEYDASDFTFIIILLSSEDFYALIRFNFPMNFPAEPPQVMYQSIYNICKRGNIWTDVIRNACYNSHWESKRMVEGVLFTIKKEIHEFRRKAKQSYMF